MYICSTIFSMFVVSQLNLQFLEFHYKKTKTSISKFKPTNKYCKCLLHSVYIEIKFPLFFFLRRSFAKGLFCSVNNQQTASIHCCCCIQKLIRTTHSFYIITLFLIKPTFCVGVSNFFPLFNQPTVPPACLFCFRSSLSFSCCLFVINVFSLFSYAYSLITCYAM